MKDIHLKYKMETGRMVPETPTITTSDTPLALVDYVHWLEEQVKNPPEYSPRVAFHILDARDSIVHDRMEDAYHALYQITSPGFRKLSHEIWKDVEKVAKLWKEQEQAKKK